MLLNHAMLHRYAARWLTVNLSPNGCFVAAEKGLHIVQQVVADHLDNQSHDNQNNQPTWYVFLDSVDSLLQHAGLHQASTYSLASPSTVVCTLVKQFCGAQHKNLPSWLTFACKPAQTAVPHNTLSAKQGHTDLDITQKASAGVESVGPGAQAAKCIQFVHHSTSGMVVTTPVLS